MHELIYFKGFPALEPLGPETDWVRTQPASGAAAAVRERAAGTPPRGPAPGAMPRILGALTALLVALLAAWAGALYVCEVRVPAGGSCGRCAAMLARGARFLWPDAAARAVSASAGPRAARGAAAGATRPAARAVRAYEAGRTQSARCCAAAAATAAAAAAAAATATCGGERGAGGACRNRQPRPVPPDGH